MNIYDSVPTNILYIQIKYFISATLNWQSHRF